MANPISYSAVWWVPDGHRRFYGEQHTGTLTYYGDKLSTLVVIHEPTQGTIFRAYDTYDVIWGRDAGGDIYTLFGATLTQHLGDFSRATFIIRYILIGKHVQSLEEPFFDKCLVRFQFLNHWALENRINGGASHNQTNISLDLGYHIPFLTIEVEDGVKLMLSSFLEDKRTRYSFTANQETYVSIESTGKVSISKYLRTISEFSQFLSIALFAEQQPSEVVFSVNGDNLKYPLLGKRAESAEPWVLSLIKFDELKERVPEMFGRWHTNYDRVYPISHYLIRAFSNTTSFDIPDFVCIAQALDGYFKRFVYKKGEIDIRQYKQQIEFLLDKFKGVEVIERINLDAEILTQTRHKYVHFIPDEDEKIVNAVDDMGEMYWLMQKGVVLLTCCILDMLGLSTDEINLCCNNSLVNQIVISIPTWM